MRLWIDGQCFQTPSNVRGIGRYVAEWLAALARVDGVDLIVSLNANLADEAIAARRYLASLIPSLSIVTWHGITNTPETQNGFTLQRRADEQILAHHINQIAPDVAICPSPFEGFDDWSVPFLDNASVTCPTACIFHDAIPHRFPEHYFHHPGLSAAYYRRLMAVRRYDLVLCNSEFTADEYRAILGKSNCIAIGAGLSTGFASHLRRDPSTLGPVAGDPSASVSPAPTVPYVLYVGGLDWRKNLPMLIDALARVDEIRSGALSLLIAGDHSEGQLEPLRQKWRTHRLPDAGLIRSGYVSDSELAQLYQGAAMAVQPSLMEGFGLAALEAMAAGCLFLAARGGAVAEVVANEAVLFDGYAPAELARLVGRALHDKAFCRSAVEHGLRRARAFDWSRAASASVEALRTLCADNGETLTRRMESPGAAPPRLIMDVTATARSPEHSGIQRVIRRLTETMRSMADTEHPHDLVLSYSDDASGWYAVEAAQAWAISRDPRDRLGFGGHDIHFMMDSSWEQPDVHRSRLRDALVAGQPVVQGIHDLGPLTMPAMTIKGMPEVFSKWFEFVLGYSTGIICVSRAVADEVLEVIEALRVPRAFDIGYLQLGSNFADGPAGDDWLSFLGDTPTFIMVGTIEPRKGHALALAAFERLWARGRAVNLLIIGKPGWNTRFLQERLAFHPEAERRLFVRPGVSDAQLRGAYQRATALVMASWLEGFGLPVVEAGAQGCRVVLSDIPVFREVGEGAPQAFFFRQGDPQALAETLEQVLTTPPRTEQRTHWPGWDGTARQVQAMVLGNRWYKRYVPAAIDANAVPANIGRRAMAAPLDETQRDHALRWVEGPEISEDGRELRFTIGARNLGRHLWSGRHCIGKDSGAIAVGSHIMTGNGDCLDWDNPRLPVPFVVLPGKEILAPICVSTDWLARGADAIAVEVVQEGVAWFGSALTLPLWQPPLSPSLPDSATPTAAQAQPVSTASHDDASALHLFPLREPFTVAGSPAHFVLLGAVNTSHKLLTLPRAQWRSRLRVRCFMGTEESAGRIVGCFAALPPGGHGLLLLAVDAEPFACVTRLCVEHRRLSGQWRAALEDIHLTP